MMKPFTPLSAATTSLAFLLGLTGGWIGEQAIAPAPAFAYTNRMEVALEVQPGEAFETVLRRAEAVARAAAQRSFDRDILITDVAITITAEYQSRIAPVLTLEATRNQWRSRPDTRRWAIYYRNAKPLLGMDRNPTSTATNPVATPTPTVVPVATPASPQPPSSEPNQPSTVTSPTDTTSPSNQPDSTPILPDRILTPGGIGK